MRDTGTEEYRKYQREYMRAWRRKSTGNAKRQSASARAWQMANPKRNALNAYRARSLRHGIDYSLDDELFFDLLTDNCFYCGKAPEPINGVDRVDNRQGYVDGNVVTSCGMCNRAKNNKSLSEFSAWATRLSAHRESWAGLGA